MEKNIGFGTHSSIPLPTAPPSYEEAIASAAGEPVRPPVTSPPYPLGPASVPMPISMPMPCT